MSFREILLAVLLTVGAGLIVRGVGMWSEPLGYVAAGVSVIGLAVLLLAEVV